MEPQCPAAGPVRDQTLSHQHLEARGREGGSSLVTQFQLTWAAQCKLSTGVRKVQGIPWPLCPPSFIHGCSARPEDLGLLTHGPFPPSALHTYPIPCLSSSHLPPAPPRSSYHPAPAPVHLPTSTISSLSNLTKRKTASSTTPLQALPHSSGEDPSTWHAALQPLQPHGIRCSSSDASGAMSSVLLCAGPLYEPVCSFSLKNCVPRFTPPFGLYLANYFSSPNLKTITASPRLPRAA